MYRRFILILIMAIMLLASFSPTQAASNLSIAFSGASNEDNTCSASSHYSRIGFTGTVDDWSGIDFIAHITTDGNGELIYATLVPTGVGTSVSVLENNPHGIASGGLRELTARPIVSRLYEFNGDPNSITDAQIYPTVQNSAILAEYSYDPASFVADCRSLPFVIPSSGATPPNFAGAEVVAAPVFESEDLNFRYGLDVWGIDDEGNGFKAFYVSGETLSNLPESPEENTLIASTEDEYISLYQLTTGEYQINIGPDIEGNVQVVIFTGVPPTNVYRNDFNIYDILGDGD